MQAPVLKKETTETLLETRFIKLYDLQYAPGKHYFNASRRTKDDLIALKSREALAKMHPDAVSCIVIAEVENEEPKLVLFNEFRYPAGQFLLSPPAGLIDPKDAESGNAAVSAAKREIFEETGLKVEDSDRIFTVNPFLFSTPGMSDESNALVCAVLHPKDLSCLTQSGAVGSECFDGFVLLTKEEAKRMLRQGWDDNGIYYSIFTWAVMIYFVTDLWKEEN